MDDGQPARRPSSGGADHDAHAKLPRSLTILFGLVAITAFGSWFYGFGVLVAPMEASGLPEQVVAGAYGVSLFGAGLLAMVLGRRADRATAAPMFPIGAGVITVGTVVIVVAPNVIGFAVAAVVTGTTIGGLGYYALLHATITRLAPHDRTRAITVNTLWGAFASPVFLPLMGWLGTTWSWQVAMVVANTTVVASFVVTGIALASHEPPAPEGRPDPAKKWLTGWWQRPAHGRRGAVPQLALVAAMGGATTSVLILYQVPAMTDAGLALALASTLAGARGLAQLLGRLPLPAVIARIGSGATLAGSLALLAVAALLLPVSGGLATAAAFVAVGGVAVGAMTTVENIFATDVVPATTVGASLGVVALARGVGGAIGPTMAGQVTSMAGSRTPVLVAVAVVAVATAFLVIRVQRHHGPAA